MKNVLYKSCNCEYGDSSLQFNLLERQVKSLVWEELLRQEMTRREPEFFRNLGFQQDLHFTKAH
jgi:hypothetical protein